MSSALQKLPCKYYKSGTCRFGAKCKFSHDPAIIAAGQRRPESANGAASTPTRTSFDDLFIQWRYLFPKPSAVVTKLSVGQMTTLCRQLLELVQGPTATSQQAIDRLASEGGMLRLTELFDQPFESMSQQELIYTCRNQLLPLFEAVTVRNVKSSPFLESRLMTFYNYVFGNGRRATTLFKAMLGFLNATTSRQPSAAAELDRDCRVVVSALQQMVSINTLAQVNDDLKSLVEEYSVMLASRAEDGTSNNLTVAYDDFEKVQVRFGLLASLPTPSARTMTSSTTKARFHLAQDLPGDLSTDGVRHDNDFADIRNISILPTLQEILCSRTEYLPLLEPQLWHIGGMEGLLDRQFRLLREDTIGQLRDIARVELLRLRDVHAGQPSKLKKTAGIHVYANTTVNHATFNERTGLELVLAFDQPSRMGSQTSRKHRDDFWQSSKRLQSEALLCLLGTDNAVIFCTVTGTPHVSAMHHDERQKERQDLSKTYNLSGDSDTAYVFVKAVQEDDVRRLLELFGSAQAVPLSLIEFPGVLLPAFMPTLQAMKHLSHKEVIPFANILVSPTGEMPAIAPPAYAAGPDFAFDLSNLTRDKSTLRVYPRGAKDNDVENVVAKTSLDLGQAQALVSALTQSFSLIQGPPGTGKSFTGTMIVRALLENKSKAELGPILCVCFTNHALDQQLEKQLDAGVTQIVRIGGQSKSERLLDVNLRNLASQDLATKTEKSERWQVHKALSIETAELKQCLDALQSHTNTQSVLAFLQEHHPDIALALDGGHDHRPIDDERAEDTDLDDRFTLVKRRKTDVIMTWLNDRQAPRRRAKPRSLATLHITQLSDMTTSERRDLFATWCEQSREAILDRLDISLTSYKDLQSKLATVRAEQELRVLRGANVIGVTTSGLARNLDLLSRLDAKVLVCEEAGEILEAHSLTALFSSIEHVILIGDHLQLRPHVQNYSLSMDSQAGSPYALDLSLFERLVTQDARQGMVAYPYNTLNVQRRMHPSVSQLVRQTLYPALEDGGDVASYPAVVGMKDRLYWFDHDQPEDSQSGDIQTSRTNAFECEMVAALVGHLVKQGVYRQSDIAILTPYLGQLRALRRKLSQTYEIILNSRDTDDLMVADETDAAADQSDPTRPTNIARGTLSQALRIATVDNFQGEEAKVIVISLVRSNSECKPGFLRSSNRINVLLSRAQHGMYIVGNAATTSSVEMWSDVLGMLKDGDRFGRTLALQCPRHPDTPISIEKPEDFVRLAPEAGCELPCEQKLVCGHACTAKCHADILHEAVYCTKPCTRPKIGCTHNCPRVCGAPCSQDCGVLLSNLDVELECGHTATALPCYQAQDLSRVTCSEMTDKVVAGCKHNVSVPCHEDVNDKAFHCSVICGTILPCGHACTKTCSQCQTFDENGIAKVDHGPCTKTCGRSYTTCSHACEATCHGKDACPLCDAVCEIRCYHSRCHKKCHEPCTPCAEAVCASQCLHTSCTMPCAAPCNHLPCSERCPKLLACGHQCPSLCGEVCPQEAFCQICAVPDIKAQQADMLCFEPYSAIDLDVDPCLFTQCGHIFTVTSMDGIMDMGQHYTTGDSGACIFIKDLLEPPSSKELKSCPTCRGPLRGLARYGRIVRRSMLDELTKRFVAWSHVEHNKLTALLANEQQVLSTSEKGQRLKLAPNRVIILGGAVDIGTTCFQTLPLKMRYKRIFALRKDIQQFERRVEADEQPYQRIVDLIETVRRSGASHVHALHPDAAELQPREHLQAMSLSIRCDISVISDLIRLLETSEHLHQARIGFSIYRTKCSKLLAEATQTYNIRQVAEARLHWACFAIMEINACATYASPLTDSDGNDAATELLAAEVKRHFDAIEALCDEYAGPTEGLHDELQHLRKQLADGKNNSMKMIVRAMAETFRGTGHWYRCVRGHAFTIGECGMPMETAQCPTCGSAIGGQNHQAVEGVTAADDLEAMLSDLGI